MAIIVSKVVCNDRTFFIYNENKEYWIENIRTAYSIKPLSCYDSIEAAIAAIETKYTVNAIIKDSSKTALEVLQEAENRSHSYYSINNKAVKDNIAAAIMRGANTFESTPKGNSLYRVWLHLLANDKLTAVPHLRYTSIFTCLETLANMGWIELDDIEKTITVSSFL